MINIRSENEIELLSQAGQIVYDTHKYLEDHIKPGITTEKLDRLAEGFIRKHDAYPSFKNYNGFPKSICTSINEQVVHGIPSNIKLENGDIISIDIGACFKGYHGDSAWTYKVGSISKDKEYLLEHTKISLYKGLEQVVPGNHIGDISNAIEQYATKHNLGVVKELVGHGVGSKLHEQPDIPNYGSAGKGSVIKKGMTLAIEPMLNLGSEKIEMLDDDWTIVTVDNSPSAHFEHTVLVTDDGYQILTGDDNNE